MDIEFEELGLFVGDGGAFGSFTGSAEIDHAGNVLSIELRERAARIRLSPATKDSFESDLFRRLAACLRFSYADDIADYIRTAARDYATDMRIREAV